MEKLWELGYVDNMVIFGRLEGELQYNMNDTNKQLNKINILGKCHKSELHIRRYKLHFKAIQFKKEIFCFIIIEI